MVAIKVAEVVETFKEVEFKEWKQHPVTKELFKYLQDKREELKEMWANGNFSGPSIEEMAIRSAGAQGAASVLEEILTLDSDSFKEERK